MSSLFSLGSNGSGQLGIGHEDDVSTPTQALWRSNIGSHTSIKRVTAGGNHTLILLSDGRVYYSGANNDGRCFGLHSINERTFDEFNAVALEQPFDGTSFSLCTATWEASIGVLQDGRVICSGTGNRGELGLGQGVTSSPIARLISNFPPLGTTVVDLAAGMNHIVALLSNGEVFGWGAGKKGQLGAPREDCWEPRKIYGIPFWAHRAVLGTNFTYILGDPHNGEHMVIGSDKWSVISNKPAILRPWRDVAASWGSIYVLLDSGELLSWGRNDHSQLCPQRLPKIKAMAAGSEHVICVEESGQIIAWGWGEHGNCGPVVEESTFDSKGSVLSLHGNAIFVGAGCATSWIGISRE
jgi:protein ATS1